MRTIDLFAGCGGLSLGFENAGFKILAAYDKWAPAVKIYKDNFHHPIHDLDLSDSACYDGIKKYKPQIIIGGPPCQDFSSAGKRDETLGRADLTISFSEIINNIRPEWFVMENVERITKSKILDKATKIFKSAGYGLTLRVLDASYCGVPQARKRFFLIGHLNSNDGFLAPYLDKNLSDSPMTVHDYLGDSLGIEFYYRHPRSYQRRGIFSIHEPSPTIRGVNRPIPKSYMLHSGDSTSNLEIVRPLTTKERSLIQTFPEDFKLSGTKSDLEQAIGNAVPVKLAEYVARNIIEYLKDVKSNKVIKPVSANSQLEFNY